MAEYTNIDTDRVLHLEFEGVEGQVTTTDSSEYAHPVTRVGDVKITTAEHAVGASSTEIKSGNGKEGRWAIPNHAAFNFGIKNFKISCHSKSNDEFYGQTFITQIKDPEDPEWWNDYWYASFGSQDPESGAPGYMWFEGYVDGVKIFQYSVDFPNYTKSIYNEFEIERSGGTFLFKLNNENGVISSASEIGSQAFPNFNVPLLIGGAPGESEGTTDRTTYMDEFIIDVGNASNEFIEFSDTAEYSIELSGVSNESLEFSDVTYLSLFRDGVYYLEETLNDSLQAAETVLHNNNMNSGIDDNFAFADTGMLTWPLEAESIMNASDEITFSWVHEVLDEIVFTDAIYFVFSKEVIDSLFIYDEIQHGWKVSLTDSIDLTDVINIVLGLMISDWITLIDTQTNNWNGREIVNQTLNLYDIARGSKHYDDTINDSVAIADTSILKLTVEILEYFNFTELAVAVTTMSNTVSESISLADTNAWAYYLLIQETLSVVDTNSLIASFTHTLIEQFSAVDSVTPIKQIGTQVNDGLTISEAVTSKGTLYSIVYDTIAMNVTVELAGEVYECYVLNTPKFHPSMYSGFDFNSYCVFENRAFGANDTGIYELTGGDDAGNVIHTGAILSQTDFGSRNYKRFRKGYLGISGTSPVMVFECEDGSRKVYSIDTKGMVVASHEQKSKEWKLSIAEFDTLDVMKLIPIILSK